MPKQKQNKNKINTSKHKEKKRRGYTVGELHPTAQNSAPLSEESAKTYFMVYGNKR
jgi:hypothetical protein